MTTTTTTRQKSGRSGRVFAICLLLATTTASCADSGTSFVRIDQAQDCEKESALLINDLLQEGDFTNNLIEVYSANQKVKRPAFVEEAAPPLKKCALHTEVSGLLAVEFSRSALYPPSFISTGTCSLKQIHYLADGRVGFHTAAKQIDCPTDTFGEAADFEDSADLGRTASRKSRRSNSGSRRSRSSSRESEPGSPKLHRRRRKSSKSDLVEEQAVGKKVLPQQAAGVVVDVGDGEGDD